MVIEGPTDAEVFQAYVQHVLVPHLQPNNVVVWNPLSPHKTADVIARFAHCGFVSTQC